jgi:hypothetical protein
MERKGILFGIVASGMIAILLTGCQEAAKKTGRTMFCPPPLKDEWSRWLVGEWEGVGGSEAGSGTGIVRIEPALNGQFLFCFGTARITEMTPEQAQYLKDQMHASDEEIERVKRTPYTSLDVYTIDQETGEVVAFMFDSLRCIATGRGTREGNTQTIEWRYATGHQCTSVTERLGEDRMAILQKTRMPDSSVFTEKGESIRRKPLAPAEKR